MTELETKIREISLNYGQLKRSEQPEQKSRLTKSIIVLCTQAQKMLEKEKHNQETFIKKRQISEIKNIAIKIEQKQKNLKMSKKLSSKSLQEEVKVINMHNEINKDEYISEQASKRVVRAIIFQQLGSRQMNVSPNQLQDIVKKLQQNAAVMEEIKNLIHDQGGDLQNIQEKIKKAFDQTENTNKNLQEAASIQLRARLRKIRLGFSGIMSSIGFAILGIPGALLGFVTGFKLGKVPALSNS